MSRIVWLARFFRVVPPVPPLLVGLLAVTAAVTAIVVLLNPSRAADALVPVFVLQMFAASTGFMVPARRGYYDLLLTRVGGRLRVALLHWAASIAPGAVTWLLLAVVEMAANASTRTAVLSSGSLAAMWLMSCIPWAATTALPRFAGGLGWLVILVAGATLAPDETGLLRTLRSPEPSPWSALAFFVYPVGLAGQHLTPAQLLTVAPGVTVAALSVVGACAWLERVDIRLEAAQ